MSKEKLYTGKEKLKLKGEELPYGILEFWQLSLSNILFSMNRGTFAEFIVRCALSEGGFESPDDENGSIREFDIAGPMIASVSRRARIEVKSVARYKYDPHAKEAPLPLRDSKLVFGIRYNKNKKDQEERAEKPLTEKNDLYVFCYYKGENTFRDILNLDYWEFYVLPTFTIENDARLKKRSGISVYCLKQIGVRPVAFGGLYQEILKQIGVVSEYMGEGALL